MEVDGDRAVSPLHGEGVVGETGEHVVFDNINLWEMSSDGHQVTFLRVYTGGVPFDLSASTRA